MAKLVKFKTNKKYKGKDGKEHNSYCKAVELENGKRILIRAVNPRDDIIIDALCEYVG